MKPSSQILWVLILPFFFASCEKDISLALHHTESPLVVEGTIETGKPPVVILTRSMDFFSMITPALMASAYVHGAVVEVSDGQRTITLKEYAADTTNGNKVYFYTVDSTQLQQGFTGKRGGVYSLKIEAEGNTYEAVTTIPAKGMRIDSLWYMPANTKKPEDSNKVILVAKITDPPEKGDAVRYFTKRNREPFYPGLNSVADDELTNGTTFDFDMDRGVDKNQRLDVNNYGFFFKGDTIMVKFCDIDRTTYDFWRTWEYAYSSNGNPFSSPIKILGNIKGALGYWGGYATHYKTIIIPN